jgi:hypothetical protein
MVGGSQGVRKVLIYSGFNIFFYFLYAKGFQGLGFLRLFWEIFYLVSCVSWLVTSMFHHENLAGNKGLLQLLFNLGIVGA